MIKTIILLIIAFSALMVFNFLVKTLWRIKKDGRGAFRGKLKSVNGSIFTCYATSSPPT